MIFLLCDEARNEEKRMIPMQQMTDINTSFDLVIRMVGYNMLLSGATIIIVFLRTRKKSAK